MTQQLPGGPQITELSHHITGCVAEEFIDANGHMNVRHYLELGSLGADVLVRNAGIDDSYRNDRRLGVFTAEHHLRYYGELLAGDTFSVHARALARSEKVIHLMTFLLDTRRGVLSSTLEIALIHVDLETRRPTAIPTDIAALLDGDIAQSNRLTWHAPVCGAMGVRR